MNNKHLNKARSVKNDEFYTLYEDVEEGVEKIKDELDGKIIYCPCDDYKVSQFYAYFKNNFKAFGIKLLISTSLGGYKCEFNGITETISELKEGGSFESEECTKIKDASDIIITNPPFSLWRIFYNWCKNKKFFILGFHLAITLTNIFEDYFKGLIYISKGKKMNFTGSDKEVKCVWYSNIKELNNVSKLYPLIEKYTPEKYPKYDKYDAIEVSKSKNIPYDYFDLMGVPASFLDNLNKNQFEIIGLGRGSSGNRNRNGIIKPKLLIDGKKKFIRLIIRRKDNMKKQYEKVSPSHPDKIADRIAGAIVDKADGFKNKIAVEVLIGHGSCNIITEGKVVSESDIKEIVKRIAGDVKLNLIQVPQDEELAKNNIGCGDNGIFKGVPVNNQEKELSRVMRNWYSENPYDGKAVVNGDNATFCLSNTKEFKSPYENTILNPLGYWTGGVNVDSGATNRKLGSDMGRAVTGGGIHGKDIFKADVSVNIWCHCYAQEINGDVTAYCSIGDKEVRYETIYGESGVIDFSDCMKVAEEYIKNLGGFEKLAEWGLI